MTKNLNTMLIRRGIRPMGDVRAARRIARQFWSDNGASYSYLLTRPDDNVKLAKSDIPTFGLSLAPANVSGRNTCPWSTPLCRKGCLNTAGKGELAKVQRGRVLKSRFLAQYPDAFVTILVEELHVAVAKYGRILMRLNVLSDLDWFDIYPAMFSIRGVDFYDYTKSNLRYERYLRGELPGNYRLVFSASERTSDADVAAIIERGGNVAMVFDKAVPDTHAGMPVVNGDQSDNRYDERYGVIVGLKAKGRMRSARYVTGGFVRKAG